jgi:hypothetical protein
MEACYSTAADLGGWILLEDFIVPKPEIWNQVPNSTYHHFWSKSKPVLPVEYTIVNEFDTSTGLKIHEDLVTTIYGTGYSAARRGVQIATFDNKLWARSMTYMGRAYLIPLLKNQNGVPEEFYLFISNSHNCASPYRLYIDPNISADTLWMKTGPIGLRDVTGNTFAVLAGMQTEKSNPLTAPICPIPFSRDVLIPNAPDGFNGTWVNPRPGDTGVTGYDFSTRVGLFLGEKGASFLGGNSSTGQLTHIHDYTCLSISEWLCPTKRLESIHWDIVCSSADRELIITRLSNYFFREIWRERFLPMTWGYEELKETIKDENGEDKDIVTAQIKLSFGKEKGMTEDNVPVTVISVTELSFPPGTFDPPEPRISAEEVFKDPYTINFFRIETGTPLAMQVRAAWFSEPDPIVTVGTWPYGIPSPFPSLVYQCSGRNVGLYFVNPDTGELTTWDHSFTNVASNDLIIRFPVEPSPGVWGAEFRDAGFVAIPQTLPEWLDDGNWRHRRYINSISSGGQVFKNDDYPGVLLRSSIRRSGSFGLKNSTGGASGTLYPYPGYPGDVTIRFFDTSTLGTYFWADNRFGTVTGSVSGGTVSLNTSGWVSDFYQGYNSYDLYGDQYAAFHYCRDPITTFDGKTRYKKNLVIWTCRSGEKLSPSRVSTTAPSDNPFGSWSQSYLLIARIDYNPDVIDFDAEITRGTLYKENE